MRKMQLGALITMEYLKGSKEASKSFDEHGEETLIRCTNDCAIEDHPIYKEVNEAYTEETRNLGFRASQSVNASMAQEIMQKICPEYNGFEAEFLGLFPDDCQIFLAREGSVCIYVRPGKKKLPTLKKLHADEYDVMTEDNFGTKYHCHSVALDHKTNFGGYKDEVRIWWD